MSQPTHLWINGQISTIEAARISPFDHGLLVGDGVFETLPARNGALFAAREHWERMVHSCEVMGLIPPTWDVFEQGLLAVLDANGLTDARLRVTLTSGEGPLGSERGPGEGTLIVTAAIQKPWPPTESVCLVPWTRNEHGALAGVKSISYGENVRALAYAKARHYNEALLANTRGELCEGTGSNIFVVIEGRLLTPPLSSGCLAGVTRALVLQACRDAGLAYAEEAMPTSVLQICEEAFLTSSTRDVHPIAEIDARPLPHAPGPVTQVVKEAFADLVRRRGGV